MEQSGVEVLLQSLKKKNVVLDRMIELAQRQEEMLKQENLDVEGLDRILEEQDMDKLGRWLKLAARAKSVEQFAEEIRNEQNK